MTDGIDSRNALIKPNLIEAWDDNIEWSILSEIRYV